MIVKIQKALFPENGPALIYDRTRSLQLHADRLPAAVAKALAETPKVYWNVEIGPDGALAFGDRAPHQTW